MDAISERVSRRFGLVLVGSVLLVCAPILNYVLERHSIFAIWENSQYPVSWTDLLYPPFCVFLFLFGLGLIIVAASRRQVNRRLVLLCAAIVLAPTILYTAFSFAMQFLQTGADRLGECRGLDQAAASSHVIPEATWKPGHPAVACGVERRGVFLSYYNHVSVYGVADPTAQDQVLERVTEHYREAHTHPVQVMFYEGVDVSIRHGEGGESIGSARPGKLIRIESIR